MRLVAGKLNIIIDGQFGSTGKGLVANYVGLLNHVDIAITNASPNAGHTFYDGETKHVTRHLPISGILNRRSTIYLCAGAIIDPNILLKEIKDFDIDPSRIIIHPRAAVIERCDIDAEQDGPVSKIASTRKGVGASLVRKINREAELAVNHPKLREMITCLDTGSYLNQGCTAVMEVPQGFDLSINSGLSYPYCTSREITVSSALSDAQLHPSFLGKVIVCIRTYPIRVGHLIDEEGNILGESGPFYNDSEELTWNKIGVPAEYTTNTNRVRRVATFSMKQYGRMIDALRPDYVVLNFANYIKNSMKLDKLIRTLPEVTHVSFGPTVEDVKPVYRGHEL